MIELISGAIVMGYGLAALFFYRFWRQSRDRLFAIFALAFGVLGIQRILLSVTYWSSHPALLYSVRLAAFLLILAAIVDKNRKRPA